MADRYWVGGTGTWDTLTTTNWSATSGGAAGASVPTVADSVFFDQATTYTITMTGALACLDITVSAGTVTFATGTGPTLNVRGSMTLIAGTVWSSTGAVTFSSTTTGKTITTNSVSIAASFIFNGGGGGWTLGSSLTLGANGSVTVNGGTFATGNWALTASSLITTSATTRAINLGASSVTLTGANPINISSTTLLTFTAGTSLINCTSTGTLTFTSPGLTFYDVSFTGVPTIFNSTRTISGVNTFRNLTFTPYANGALGAIPIVFATNQTITGTWSGSGASQIRRIWYRATTLGSPVSITLTSPQTISNADFRDITAVTSAITATNGGNCGGNTNITGFPTAKTVYWNLTGSQDWSATGWATLSGGTPAAANFPLAQDTAIFDNTGAATTVTTNGSWNMGTVNMSARTTAMNFTVSGSQNIHGNWSFGTGVTVTSGSGNYSFCGRGTTQLISCAGKSFGAGAAVDVSNIGGIVRLSDAFTTSAGGNGFLSLNSGTLDLVSYTATCGRLYVNGTGPGSRTIAFGTGNIAATINSGTAVTLDGTSFTRTGTPTINVPYSGATAVAIALGTNWTESNVCSLNFTAGTYPLTFLNSGSQACLDVNFTGYSGTWSGPATSGGSVIYGSLTLSTGMTVGTTSNLINFKGTSGTKTVTSNGKTINFPIVFNGIGSTWQLQDNLTINTSYTLTLDGGTLNINNKVVTTGIFSSTTGNFTRAIGFGTAGTGKITAAGVGSATVAVLAFGSSGNLTITGTPIFELTNTTFPTCAFGSALQGPWTEANALSISVGTSTGTAGIYVANATNFISIGYYKDINLTGFTGSFSNGSGYGRTLYGSLTVSSVMTIAADTQTTTFAATSGIKTITSNGNILNMPIIFNGVGGNWQLQDALTMGLTRPLTHTNGTINLNGKTLTVGTQYLTATGTKNLTFNGGTLACPTSSTTSFNNSVPTGFTTTAGTGTGTISMTSSLAKTFVGGGSTFNCNLNQGGAGTLTINGSNTFSGLTNTVQPATILFGVGTTTTVTNFLLSGTAGNLITLNVATGTTQFVLSKSTGTASVSYCSIYNSNATGGAIWQALTSNGNINNGNNTGWIFSTITTLPNFFVFFN